MGDLKTMHEATMMTTLFKVLATLCVTGPEGKGERVNNLRGKRMMRVGRKGGKREGGRKRNEREEGGKWRKRRVGRRHKGKCLGGVHTNMENTNKQTLRTEKRNKYLLSLSRARKEASLYR